MAKDINSVVFDEETELKLEIFGDCFGEWLPVFINDTYTNYVYIFDFFAGSGQDVVGNMGSPLVLLDKARGKDRKYCIKEKKDINFLFNEGIEDKSKELEVNVENHLKKCKETNECAQCIYSYKITNSDFQEVFNDPEITKIFESKDVGKFVLLDQYGFKEINEDIFKKLVSYPKTDFIFFISSSFINRFKDHPNTVKHIDTSKIDFDNCKPTEIHRAVAHYFRSLIPKAKEYYLHHFTIRKEAHKGSYHGLIFGTNHTLGMEKFLKVCWNYDGFSGEANYNIDNNFEEDSLFFNPENPIKKDLVKQEISDGILSGRIKDNITGLKYSLRCGCEPGLFTEVVKELETKKKIVIEGEKNYSSTNIHKAKGYQIKRLDNGAQN